MNAAAPIRILLAGANGQLGLDLARRAAETDGVELHARGRDTLDITDAAAVQQAVEAVRPDWVINAAAYTAVDRAESEPEAAFAVNRDGAANLARAAATQGARMLQVSTDYVFDGELGRPYRPNDTPNPINVYGESKLAGERAVDAALGDHALILRTAWVYAAHGQNFLRSMLRLMAEREELGVIEDQIGTPTSTLGLAETVLAAVRQGLTGTHHWTDAGVASWYDFAVAIRDEAHALGMDTARCRIRPISWEEYPTAARRPANSRLDKSTLREQLGRPGAPWRDALRSTLGRIPGASPA